MMCFTKLISGLMQRTAARHPPPNLMHASAAASAGGAPATTGKRRPRRDPRKPKRPGNAYNFFVADYFARNYREVSVSWHRQRIFFRFFFSLVDT